LVEVGAVPRLIPPDFVLSMGNLHPEASNFNHSFSYLETASIQPTRTPTCRPSCNVSMAEAKAAAVQARLQAASLAFTKLETGAFDSSLTWEGAHSTCGRLSNNVSELSGVVEARQRLDSQLSENELVLKVTSILPRIPVGPSHSRYTTGVQPAEISQHGVQARRAISRPAGPGRGEAERGEAARVYQIRNVSVPRKPFCSRVSLRGCLSPAILWSLGTVAVTSRLDSS
jgi:hypothetical protein